MTRRSGCRGADAGQAIVKVELDVAIKVAVPGKKVAQVRTAEAKVAEAEAADGIIE